MTSESAIIRQALNTHYSEWRKIEAMIKQTNDEHTKEVLRRLIFVKQNRVKNHGN